MFVTHIIHLGFGRTDSQKNSPINGLTCLSVEKSFFSNFRIYHFIRINPPCYAADNTRTYKIFHKKIYLYLINKLLYNHILYELLRFYMIIL